MCGLVTNDSQDARPQTHPTSFAPANSETPLAGDLRIVAPGQDASGAVFQRPPPGVNGTHPPFPLFGFPRPSGEEIQTRLPPSRNLDRKLTKSIPERPQQIPKPR